jgi:hypothetical protein
MANTYTLIEAKTLASNAASITFSSIPATYTDFVIRWSIRTDSSSSGGVSNLQVTTNGSATSIYSYTYMRGNGVAGSSSAQNAAANTYLPVTAGTNNSTATANTFASGEVYFPNYLSSAYKPFSIFNATENNLAGSAYILSQASLINSTAAISSITVDAAGWNFIPASSFYLYGIKNS